MMSKIKKFFSLFKRKHLFRKVYEWDERSGLGWIVTYGSSEEECDTKYYNGDYVVETYYFGRPIGLGSDRDMDIICSGNRTLFQVK